MKDETVGQRLGKPPADLNEAFFAWVAQAQKLAAVTFVDLSEVPMLKEDRDHIEAVSG